MNKIEKLSKKQIEKLVIYKDKWVGIGLSIARANRFAAEQAAKDAYKIAGLEEPKYFIWVDSPIGGLMAAKLLKEVSKKYKTYDTAQVWAQVGDQVGAQVWAQVRAQVGDQVWAQVGDLKNFKEEWNDLWFWGSMEYYLSFYDYFLEVTNLECCKKIEPLIRLSKEVGFTWFYKNAVIFSERPSEINLGQLNERGISRLHKEGGMAIKYADGYGFHCLNGIRVPEYAAETPVDQITKKMIISEKNADIRREVVRRLGSDRLLKILDHKVLDSFEGYELITFDIGDGRVRPFLSMQNPSVDLRHIEGVSPGVKTVKEAICYRNGLTIYEKPIQLT